MEKLEGMGTMQYTDGSKYEGNWFRDKKHGKGTFTDKHGNSRKAEWFNGDPL